MKILTNLRISDAQVESLRQVSPQVQVVRETDAEKCRKEMADADILYSFVLPGPLQEAKALQWLQLPSAGAEHLFEAGIEKTSAVVTTASGIHGPAMAEYAIWAMVTVSRKIPQIFKENEKHQWRPSRLRTYYADEISGKTVGIVGLGAVGGAIGQAARAMGMRVLGLRRSGGQGGDKGPADEVYGPEGMLQMLSQCDFVIVAVPTTGETRNLIGEKELQAMKPSAYLINVARGGIVDEAAMARALRENRIAGAVIDTFSQEPLPPDSEMWDLPNLVITPHISGNTVPYMDRATELFIDNLRRYVAGEPLVNVLDKKRGY